MQTKKEIRKDNLSAIKLMMMGKSCLYLSEPLELEDETIIALSWIGGEVYYSDDNGCQVCVGILCLDELEKLRKAMYNTINAE